jgi:hypothetical protein
VSNRDKRRIFAAVVVVATLFGHPAAAAVAEGPPVVYSARPAGATGACATRAPVCVHGAPGAAAAATLAAFERAWATLTGPLELPPPDTDPTTLVYDVFLSAPDVLGGESAATLLEARDVRSPIDRARAFTLVDARVRPGCHLDALAARELARAIALRVSPALDEGSMRAQTSYFAQLAVPCAAALAHDAVSEFQSRPDRALPDASIARYADGAALFWSRLDWAFGRYPGAIVLATWALAPTSTPLGAARWRNEPDGYDVLRKSFEGVLFTRSTIGDVFLDFGVARAFFGSADDGQHQPETRIFGDAARVPFEWDIPWPTTPRRLAARAPVHPSGASYVLVRRAGARADARLRVEIAWEEHALYKWTLVKIDAGGKELGRVPIATKERATEAQMTFADLGGADRLLLVGVNAGDPAYQFDPDDGIWEPHGFLVTLAEE